MHRQPERISSGFGPDQTDDSRHASRPGGFFLLENDLPAQAPVPVDSVVVLQHEGEPDVWPRMNQKFTLEAELDGT